MDKNIEVYGNGKGGRSDSLESKDSISAKISATKDRIIAIYQDKNYSDLSEAERLQVSALEKELSQHYSTLVMHVIRERYQLKDRLELLEEEYRSMSLRPIPNDVDLNRKQGQELRQMEQRIGACKQKIKNLQEQEHNLLSRIDFRREVLPPNANSIDEQRLQAFVWYPLDDTYEYSSEKEQQNIVRRKLTKQGMVYEKFDGGSWDPIFSPADLAEQERQKELIKAAQQDPVAAT